MKHLFIIVFILLNTTTIFAKLSGYERVDSMLKELPKMKEDTNGVNLLYNLSKEFSSINPNEGLKYSKQGVELAKSINWKVGKSKCVNVIGMNYINLSNFPKALEYFLEALKINEEIENKDGQANNLGNIGIIYYYQAKYSKALEYYHKALKIDEEIGNKNGEARHLGNIGVIYKYQHEYPKALKYFLKALKINEEIGNKPGISINIGNIGTTYSSLSNFPKALEYYYKALKISEEFGSKSEIAIIMGNIGSLYFNLSQDSVLATISEETEFVSLKKEINLNKGIEITLEAIKIFEGIGELKNRSIYLNNLAGAFKRKDDYKKAYDAAEESHKLQDSIFSKENNDKISELEKAREDDVNKLQIEKQEIQLKAQEDEKRLILMSAFGAIISIFIILTIIIVQRRKSEKLLLNVLPAKIAKRLKAKEHPIADHFDNASIIFIDIVGFTNLSSDTDPKRLVTVLNDIFTIFDKLADKHGLEKIKTIGDAYMAVAGIPEIQADHSKRTAQMALDIKKEMNDFKTSDGTEIKFRIGIDCGAVVAGVIGEKKFIYDLWSDAVNTASRMESTGESGQIQITENFKEELEKFDGNWNFKLRGEFEIKGKGLMKTYYLEEKT